MGRLLFLLVGGTAAFTAVLFIVIEMCFAVLPRFSISIGTSVLASQFISFCVVLPTLLFTDHPWGRGVGVLGFFFLLPPSLIAALVARALYAKADKPILDPKVAIALFSIMVFGIAAWMFTALPRPFGPGRMDPDATSSERYREEAKRTITEAADGYRTRGIIVNCRGIARPSDVCTNGDKWALLTKEEQTALLKTVIRSRDLAHQSINVNIIDVETGALRARSFDLLPVNGATRS